MSWNRQPRREAKVYRDDPGVELSNGPMDTVSHIAWSTPPTGVKVKHMQNLVSEANNQMHLAASSWDGTLRVYTVLCNGTQLKPNPLRMFSINCPMLACCLNEGSHAFSGGLDGIVRMHDLQNDTTTELGKHEGPCVKLIFDNINNLVISAGYDGRIYAWNGQSKSPVDELRVNGRIRDMCWLPGWIACVDSSATATIFCIKNKQQTQFNMQQMGLGHLHWTTVSLIPDKPNKPPTYGKSPRDWDPTIEWLVVGAIDGRCCVKKVSLDADGKPTGPNANRNLGYGSSNSWSVPSNKGDDYNFAAHPTQQTRGSHPNPSTAQVPVTCMDNCQRGFTFTTGGDGHIQIWNCRNKQKEAEIVSIRPNNPITALKVDPWARYIAYAYGYDWSKGFQGNDGSYLNKLYIKPCPHKLYDNQRL